MTVSTIDPNVPATGAPVSSSVVRNNFAAAASDINNIYSIIGSSIGTVQSVSIITANGVSGTVANPTTTPAITLQVDGILLWDEVPGTSQTMEPNTGYVPNNSGLVTLTLPVTAAFGKTIKVVGKGAGGWKIAQNSGQTIYFGDKNTTTGTGGHIDSSNRRDSVELVCVTANTDWQVVSSVGNFSIT